MAARPKLPPALVIGGGPVAAAAAIVLARRREVVLCLNNPDLSSPSRIDSLPIHVLGLLIELGIHPAEIGIEERYDTILTGWESASPGAVMAFPKVHVDRRLLDAALLRRAAALSAVTFAARVAADDYETVIDATGRRAATAAAVTTPDPVWVARIRTQPGRYSPAQAALRIAAMAEGYAYRLGTRTLLTLGYVSPAPIARLGDECFEESLREAGGSWILSGLPPLARMAQGRGGACSVQWAIGARARQVGDSCFAPDALAAQGLAIGLSDAARLGDGLECGSAARRGKHLATLRAAIARCGWRDSPAWRSYDRQLEAWESGEAFSAEEVPGSGPRYEARGGKRNLAGTEEGASLI